MENENEREAWNARWLRQIDAWQAELVEHVGQIDVLEALIELAESQLKQDPPE